MSGHQSVGTSATTSRLLEGVKLTIPLGHLACVAVVDQDLTASCDGLNGTNAFDVAESRVIYRHILGVVGKRVVGLVALGCVSVCGYVVCAETERVLVQVRRARERSKERERESERAREPE